MSTLKELVVTPPPKLTIEEKVVEPSLPFANRKYLEVSSVKLTKEQYPQMDKMGAICAYFICWLPFTC